MDDLDRFIFELSRSIDKYGKEQVGADDILELAMAVQKALQEIVPPTN